jgi:hypothetical protein
MTGSEFIDLSGLRCRGAAFDAQGPFDAKPLTTFVARLSQLEASAPWRCCTFEMNPVMWQRSSVVAVVLVTKE